MTENVTFSDDQLINLFTDHLHKVLWYAAITTKVAKLLTVSNQTQPQIFCDIGEIVDSLLCH